MTYEEEVKIKAEGVREAAENFQIAYEAGDPEAVSFPEVWLHNEADRMEGLVEFEDAR